jgi:hypothetical protein
VIETWWILGREGFMQKGYELEVEYGMIIEEGMNRITKLMRS